MTDERALPKPKTKPIANPSVPGIQTPNKPDKRDDQSESERR